MECNLGDKFVSGREQSSSLCGLCFPFASVLCIQVGFGNKHSSSMPAACARLYNPSNVPSYSANWIRSEEMLCIAKILFFCISFQCPIPLKCRWLPHQKSSPSYRKKKIGVGLTWAEWLFIFGWRWKREEKCLASSWCKKASKNIWIVTLMAK